MSDGQIACKKNIILKDSAPYRINKNLICPYRSLVLRLVLLANGSLNSLA